jgi:hypothetical protein
MVADGYAIEYKNEVGSYAGEAREARQARRGIMDLCSLRPDVWRDAQRTMTAFKDRRVMPRDRDLLMGPCPPPTRVEPRGEYVTPD